MTETTFTRDGRTVRNVSPGELLAEWSLGVERSGATKRAGGPRFRSVRRIPRKLAVLAAMTALIASVSGALAVPINDTGTVGPAFTTPCDVTVAANTTSADCTLGPAGAIVSYIGSSDTARQSSGTGIFDPFLRLQADPTEQGFNTDAKVTLDAKPGPWTKAILVSAIPVVSCDGSGSGPTCWELFVDINENNSAKRVSLNKVEIYFTDAAKLTGYSGFATPPGNFHELQYAFSGDILINDVNEGSGRGDLRYLVPLANIPTPPAGTYFVLYSQWGTTSGTDGVNGTGGYASDGGFEEWKVRKAPNVSIVKTADAISVNAGSPIGFTVTVTNTGAADATGVTVNDPLPSGTDVDWSIASQSPAGSCSISGTPPAVETLTCGPLTLAAGGGSLTVHVTSATTGNSCGVYDNTATFTSTNAGSGSAFATTTVSCGAIRILKNSTKGGAVANAGAVFAVDGPDAGTTADFSVTDDATAAAPDEDADIGEVCVSGLVPGATYTVNETSPPSGYGGASQLNVTVVAVAGNCSTAGLNAATFSNPPLYDLQVNFRDGGSGETSATISCSPLEPPDSTTPPTGWFTSSTYTGRAAPQTVTCTIVVDP